MGEARPDIPVGKHLMCHLVHQYRFRNGPRRRRKSPWNFLTMQAIDQQLYFWASNFSASRPLQRAICKANPPPCKIRPYSLKVTDVSSKPPQIAPYPCHIYPPSSHRRTSKKAVIGANRRQTHRGITEYVCSRIPLRGEELPLPGVTVSDELPR